MTQWWRELYDDLCADVLLERDDTSEVERTVAFLRDALRVVPGDRILDQCCGIGSLSIPLAAGGHGVIGVDLAKTYIRRARAAAAAADVSATFEVADAFEYVADEPCDAVFNWWTSFGYSPEDRDNLCMLARAFASLRPGGRFALDFMNVPGVLQRFCEKVVTERETLRGKVCLTRTSRYDAATGLMHKIWHYRLDSGEEVEHPSTVRAYTPPEIARLIRAVGFTDVQLLGDIDGSPLDLASPRCIGLGRRPA